MLSSKYPRGSIYPILFDCGRLCIQLRFHLFQAAFLIDGEDHVFRAAAIASRIERLSRRLEVTAEAGEALTTLRQKGGEFVRAYRSEWTNEITFEVRKTIEQQISHPEFVNDVGEANRRSICDKHLEDEILAMAQLRGALLAFRDHKSRMVFELGEFVEEAIHPRDIQRHFFEFREVIGNAPCGFIGGYHFIVPRYPGEVPPPEGWLRRIRGFMRDLDL